MEYRTIVLSSYSVCNIFNIINISLITYFSYGRILPENITMEQVKNAIPSLLGYTQSISVSVFDLMVLDSVFRANGFTIEKIFQSIEPSCSEIILKCKWEETNVPCENLFVTSPTRDGYCCSFNLKTEK